MSDIYDKNVNFLFGAGASSGLLPTLSLNMLQAPGGQNWGLEDLATQLTETDRRRIPLFMHYYNECIRPAELLTVENASKEAPGREVVGNYRRFLETVLTMLQRRKALERTCNLFTTNYDGCFALVAEEILRQGHVDFVLNDGTRGFKRRTLQARNFNSFFCQTGVFERHQTSIPQLNLIHLHGSVYWKKLSDDVIEVDYRLGDTPSLLDEQTVALLAPFSATLKNDQAVLDDLKAPSMEQYVLDQFWTAYKRKPIVNPTKWKFHETVYDEHYYQMLRLLSYELEKRNSVLITFGFSFADEHIRNLVLRSLSNPTLQVFVCCYSELDRAGLSEKFKAYRNVQCLTLEDAAKMNFSAFNDHVLTWPSAAKPAHAFQAASIAVPTPSMAMLSTADGKQL